MVFRVVLMTLVVVGLAMLLTAIIYRIGHLRGSAQAQDRRPEGPQDLPRIDTPPPPPGPRDDVDPGDDPDRR